MEFTPLLDSLSAITAMESKEDECVVAIYASGTVIRIAATTIVQACLRAKEEEALKYLAPNLDIFP